MGLEEIWFGQKDKTVMTEEVEAGLYLFYYDEKEYYLFGFGSREELVKWMKERGMEKVS